VNGTPRKPRILLAASGSVAAIKFGNLYHCFSEWAEVKEVTTKASLHFIDKASLPRDVVLYTSEDEWSSWNKIGDNVLHIELRRWADMMIMAYADPVIEEREPLQVNGAPRKPRILLAASGSVAAIKFGNLCHCFSEWAEVKGVATKASLHFIDKASLPKDVVLYTDEDEWSSWNKIGDNVLHIELRRWADIMVIAPLSANTLGKIAGGLCDNLLTCVVRAWDYSKPLFVAPAMNTFMWNNPFTERHLVSIDELGISLIPPVTKRLACGDYGNGAMAEPSLIHSTIRLFLESRTQTRDGRVN
ncbi:Phosphopantothenoylcysteine decarboxylase, partial [Turnera subulata]